jgi:glycosyltransferase involved in cell wall biosynthesis
VIDLKPKKLLFVLVSLSGGGAERVMIHIIKSLDKNKYETLLVLLEDIYDYREDLPETVRIICLNKRKRLDFFKLILKLRNIIISYRPDTVMSFDYYVNIISVISNMFLSKKTKIIISERNYIEEYLYKERFKWIKKYLIEFAYKKADIIISVSKKIKFALEKYFRIDPQKIKTIYNPIDLEAIRISTQENIVLPDFMFSSSPVYISAGRLVEQKRHDRLLRAFSVVKKRLHNAYLVILGKGALQDELEDLSDRLNIRESVYFAGFQSNPFVWISKSDVFVLTSDFEGFPNVIIEAMACGVPVISTNCPSGPDEIIENGRNGLLVPVDDENLLIEAMCNLVQDELLYAKIVEEGKRRVEEFALKRILNEYERYL